MGTCHKCAAPLGRGTQPFKECSKCGLMYHTTDCGQRFAAVPDLKASLEDCPKVSRQRDPPCSWSLIYLQAAVGHGSRTQEFVV